MKVLLAFDGIKDKKIMLAYLTAHEDLLGASTKFVNDPARRMMITIRADGRGDEHAKNHGG